MEFYTLSALPYDYDALEPFIDTETMKVHHDKHHQAYVDKLNAALEKDEGFVEKPIEELLMKVDHLPEDIRQAVINNGGGHANHSFFWEIMGSKSGGKPEGALLEKIKTKFGSFEDFKQKFTQEGMNRFGSGWVWLCQDSNNELILHSLPNQDSPLLSELRPLLALDVWEHAYYLKYQNRRQEYIDNWWNVVNWEKVADNYQV